MAGWWLFYSYTYFLPPWESRSDRMFCQKCIFITWNLGHTASWLKFCGTPSQSCLKPIIAGLSRKNRDEWDLYFCLTTIASSFSFDDNTYVAFYCTTEMHKVSTHHAQYNQTECGIVVTFHIRLLPYTANGVKEPTISTYGILLLLSNTASNDVEH